MATHSLPRAREAGRPMASDGSVTNWVCQLRAGDHVAAQKLWERYFRRLVGLARHKLQGRLRRFTLQAERLLNLIPSDVGRRLRDIKPNLRVTDLDDLIHDVIENVQSRERVAGFLPHRFSKVPEATTWQVQRIELVGLLKHPEPVAYLSDRLPAMAELRDAPTRPLDAFNGHDD